MMSKDQERTADLHLLEHLKIWRKRFIEELCEASDDQSEEVHAILRMESAYQLCEFFYLLRTNPIETIEQVKRLAELHNSYLVDLSKDKERMTRFGLSSDRILNAMFTVDTMPRLIQHWKDHPGALDQSNLARFLVTLMSPETCRKIIVAFEKAGFLRRKRASLGAAVIISSGIIEDIVGRYIRGLRKTIQT